MLAAVAAAPEIPAIASLLGAVALVLCWAMASGALTVWRRSLGKLLVWLADLLDGAAVTVVHVTIKPLAPLAAALRSLESTIDHYLGEAVHWSEKGAVVLFKFFISIQMWIGREIADLARDTLSAIRGTAEVTKAQAIAWTRAVYAPTIRKLTVAVDGIRTHTIPGIRTRLDTLSNRIQSTARKSTTAIAHTLPRIGNLERGATRLGKRVKALEKKLAAGAAAGLAVAILAKSVVAWLRCPSLGRALKRRSCLDFDYLDGLLTGALLIVGTISLREFAEEVGNVTDEAAGLIHGFLRDT